MADTQNSTRQDRKTALTLNRWILVVTVFIFLFTVAILFFTFVLVVHQLFFLR